jgi:hypothetical protein
MSINLGELEKQMLRRIFGPEKDEVIADGEIVRMRSFITCILFAKYN